MTDNKNLPKIIENSGLALHKTRNLLSITDKILASKRLAVVDDAWLDELIAWADENNISEEQFPRDKKEILNLTGLGLHGNQLTELPESIGKLTNLTMLQLSNNQLTELPESIDKLTNLTELFLDGNQLTELPESIGKLTNLTELYLWSNPIKSLPPELSHLNSITYFHNIF